MVRNGKQRMVKVVCEKHNKLLSEALWKCFQSNLGLDFEFHGVGGGTIRAHRMVLDAFLAPDKVVGRSLAAPRKTRSGGEICESVDSVQSCLLEFLYRGRVIVPANQMDVFLDTARRLDFRLLEDAIWAASDDNPNVDDACSEDSFGFSTNSPTKATRKRVMFVKDCYVNLGRRVKVPGKESSRKSNMAQTRIGVMPSPKSRPKSGTMLTVRSKRVVLSSLGNMAPTVSLKRANQSVSRNEAESNLALTAKSNLEILSTLKKAGPKNRATDDDCDVDRHRQLELRPWWKLSATCEKSETVGVIEDTDSSFLRAGDVARGDEHELVSSDDGSCCPDGGGGGDSVGDDDSDCDGLMNEAKDAAPPIDQKCKHCDFEIDNKFDYQRHLQSEHGASLETTENEADSNVALKVQPNPEIRSSPKATIHESQSACDDYDVGGFRQWELRPRRSAAATHRKAMTFGDIIDSDLLQQGGVEDVAKGDKHDLETSDDDSFCPDSDSDKTDCFNSDSSMSDAEEACPLVVHKCEQCEFENTNQFIFQRHLRSEHRVTSSGAPAPTFKCNECDDVFPFANDVRYHRLKAHSGEPYFECKHCVYVSDRSNSLVRHMNTMHGVGENHHTCRTCGKRCSSSIELIRHRRVHGIASYADRRVRSKIKRKRTSNSTKCTRCNFEAVNANEYEHHLVTVHGVTANGDPAVEHGCEEEGCEYVTLFRKDIRYHWLSAHSNKKCFSCPQCSFVTDRSSRIGLHQATHMASKSRYSCSKCDYATARKRRFVGHLAVIHGVMVNGEPAYSLKCPAEGCDFVAQHRKELNHHRSSEHGRSRQSAVLACSECQFETKRRRTYVRHLETIHFVTADGSPVALLVCTEEGCDFNTRVRKDMRRHCSLVHEGSYQEAVEGEALRCPKCQFETNRRRTYERHLASSHGILPDEKDVPESKCSVEGCDFSSRLSKELRYHQLSVHSGNKPYFSCMQCSYVTNRNYRLVTHNMSHRVTANIIRVDSADGEPVSDYKCNETGCQFTNAKYKEVRYHWLSTHYPEYSYSCPHCSFAENQHVKLARHQLSVGHKAVAVDGKFLCSCCTFETAEKMEYSNHLLWEHGAIPLHKTPLIQYRCPDANCDFLFFHQEEFMRHLTSSHSEAAAKYNGGQQYAIYLCHLCKLELPNKEDFEAHNLEVHRQTMKRVMSIEWRCTEDGCGFVTKRKTDFRSHCQTAHAALLKCEHCEFDTFRPATYSDHLLRTHGVLVNMATPPVREPKISNTLYLCSHCGHQATSKDSYQDHLRVAHDVTHKGEPAPKYRCDVEGCDFVTVLKGRLKDHQTHKHAGKQYVCVHCKAEFKWRPALRRHLEGVHKQGVEKCVCEVCGKGFNNRAQFEQHSQKHATDRSLKCPHCDFSVNACRKRVMTRHLLLKHDIGAGQFVCETCGRRCACKYDLVQHSRVHTKERPFKCMHCDSFASTQKSALKQHMLMVHQIGTSHYTCETCGKTCATPGMLASHVKTHGGSSNVNGDRLTDGPIRTPKTKPAPQNVSGRCKPLRRITRKKEKLDPDSSSKSEDEDSSEVVPGMLPARQGLTRHCKTQPKKFKFGDLESDTEFDAPDPPSFESIALSVPTPNQGAVTYSWTAGPS